MIRLTPSSTTMRASSSSTTWAMVSLLWRRAWSRTAETKSRLSFGCRPPCASIQTLMKSAPFVAMSYRENTRAAQFAGLLPGLEFHDVFGVRRHAGRGGHAIERILAQLRITRRRTDMAMRIDDAGYHEFAGEVQNRGIRRH